MIKTELPTFVDLELILNHALSAIVAFLITTSITRSLLALSNRKATSKMRSTVCGQWCIDWLSKLRKSFVILQNSESASNLLKNCYNNTTVKPTFYYSSHEIINILNDEKIDQELKRLTHIINQKEKVILFLESLDTVFNNCKKPQKVERKMLLEHFVSTLDANCSQLILKITCSANFFEGFEFPNSLLANKKHLVLTEGDLAGITSKPNF